MRLGKRQVEQIVYDAAQDFDAFYAQPCSPALQQYAQAKPIQVLTFDSKGVVMKKEDRKSTRLNSSHGYISYAVFCLKKDLSGGR